MRKLKIKRTDFEAYFEEGGSESAAYLDSETGDIFYCAADVMSEIEALFVEDRSLDDVLKAIETLENVGWQRDEYIAAAHIFNDDADRYRPLPKQDSRIGYGDMEAFIAQVTDENLRELLEIAINGSGAFRRFKEALLWYPQTQEAWFKFRDAREQERMMAWFAQEGIEPDFE